MSKILVGYISFLVHLREKELEKCKKEQIKEKGCTEPLLGIKSKCILMTVPKSKKCESFIMNPKCMVKK